MAQNSTDARDRKTAVISGGASGIGLAMSQYFASMGYNVAIFDVNIEAGRRVVSELASESPSAKVVFKSCDVSSWQSQADNFKEVYTEFGRVDVVCANAGISERGSSALASIEDDEPKEPDLKSLSVNLSGVIYSVKLAIHYMNKNTSTGPSRGSIICTSSNAGLYPFPVSPLYAAAKSGVIGLVRSTAPILERQKIQINALAPAVLVTNIAPDKALFKNMIITPMSTLVKGVVQLTSDPKLTGEVAEIHGDSVTLRPPHDYVDEDSRKNLENFWNLGYA
ncbi:putative short chain dehydrogenase/reductase [Cryphonectria parasitica EP155]|uniref:Short chain dehydrogenase/reductase n=1 Tax=Cryphonectria parasitica (strain ATCC 38755 / EP155) TaxID=660469 RepID=A0A9P4Y332_CRYP1|nr:putative short chain dehydrogenase/reductase [Cryphonectria parasitica EP155]KAF3765623.1 putative short chain dehydrogenase/reductase [Cryphonectria parasitica EP155]